MDNYTKVFIVFRNERAREWPTILGIYTDEDYARSFCAELDEAEEDENLMYYVNSYLVNHITK